jgi:thioredoxin-related protein
MKRLFTLLVLVLSLWTARASDLSWQSDLNAALIQARKENKAVLLDFSGSDWCSTCIRLRQQILDAPAFTAYATNKLVLVLVDFPVHKRLPDAQEKANLSLKDALEVNGFPTLVVLDSKGKKIAALDYDDATPKARRLYSEESPQALISQLKKILKAR